MVDLRAEDRTSNGAAVRPGKQKFGPKLVDTQLTATLSGINGSRLAAKTASSVVQLSTNAMPRCRPRGPTDALCCSELSRLVAKSSSI